MATTVTTTGYDLRGDLIEACSCMGPCPCWVGDDPDVAKAISDKVYAALGLTDDLVAPIEHPAPEEGPGAAALEALEGQAAA